MTSLRHLLRIMRCAQTALAVQWCMRDVDRAKLRLARAMRSYDDAVVAYRVAEGDAGEPEVPTYLKRGTK